jgi:hypothetical protein
MILASIREAAGGRGKFDQGPVGRAFETGGPDRWSRGKMEQCNFVVVPRRPVWLPAALRHCKEEAHRLGAISFAIVDDGRSQTISSRRRWRRRSAPIYGFATKRR